MRKNFLLRKYHYIHSAVEIIFPTLLFVILVALNNSIGSENQNEGQAHNQVPVSIPSVAPYPTDFCKSLRDMLRKEEENDDSKHLALPSREIYYTTVPDNKNATQVPPSTLAKHIMETVTRTVNEFLVPCCSLLLSNENFTLHGLHQGILSK